MFTDARLTVAAWLCLGSTAFVPGAAGSDFTDDFADRSEFSDISAVYLGSNVGATLELFEPLHAGKPGGHSVWLSWIAPTNGLVTLSTDGSTFDTLVGVYTLQEGDDPPLARLETAGDDDDAGATSLTVVQFGARTGMRYEIAVDGFAGATGDIQLSLDLLATDSLLPSVVRHAGDQSLRLGDTLILSVDIAPTPRLEVQWFRNDTPVPDADTPSLVVRNFQATNVGQYRLGMTVDDVQFFSARIEIEVNSEGITAALARNKLADAVRSGLQPHDGAGGAFQGASLGGGVTRGYNGTQIFDTTYATRDPLEPMHCGIPGGATYWFSYQPPAEGMLLLNTDGSDYDTLLAVYTYDPPLVDYSSLIQVGCDNNSGSNGMTSALQFSVSSNRTYFIVIDGVDGARGIAHLNYSLLSTNTPSAIPTLVRSPRSLTAAGGNTIVLDMAATGAEPLSYLWWRNGQLMAGQTNPSVTLGSIQPSQAGVYLAGVSNAAGMVFSAEARVTVATRPTIQLVKGSNATVIAFPATRGYQYRIETSDLIQTNGWQFLMTALTDGAGMIWLTNSWTSADGRFYRATKP